MSLTVTWATSAQRDLRRLDKAIAKSVVATVDNFAQTGSGDVRKISGTNEWRLRDGVYRIRFIYLDGDLQVLRVRHRREAYR